MLFNKIEILKTETEKKQTKTYIKHVLFFVSFYKYTFKYKTYFKNFLILILLFHSKRNLSLRINKNKIDSRMQNIVYQNCIIILMLDLFVKNIFK